MPKTILSKLTTTVETGLESLLIGFGVFGPGCDCLVAKTNSTATPFIDPPALVAPPLWYHPALEANNASDPSKAATDDIVASTARMQFIGKPIFIQVKEHLKYLKDVSTKGGRSPITRETAMKARSAWWCVWAASRFSLPVPTACTGPDGQMLYTWDNDRHHLELEIFSDRPAEFFYRDRETGDLWAEDYVIGDPIPAEAIEKLKLFC